MKKIFLLFLLVSTCQALFAVVGPSAATATPPTSSITDPTTSLSTAALTAEQGKAPQGKKIGWFKKMKLKVLRKAMRSQKRASSLTKEAYIILAVFALGWLAMGLLDDWEGNNWLICLLLTLLAWLPGFIFALVKLDDYF